MPSGEETKLIAQRIFGANGERSGRAIKPDFHRSGAVRVGGNDAHAAARAIDNLESLASICNNLTHLLLVRDLRRIAK